MPTENEVEPTWGNVARLGWAIYWRFIVAVLIVCFVIGFAVGLVAYFAGDESIFDIIISVVCILVSIVLYGYVLKRLMIRGFGDYRIALIKSQHHV